jgi:hypothetical protein
MQSMDTETIGEDNRDISDEITLAEYRYEEIYPSFKAGTDEKEITADLNRRFIRSLMQRRPVGNLPLKVADIGCGPCDTILMYLQGLDFVPGFIICATDFSAEYAAQGGKAAVALAEVVVLATDIEN